MKNRFALLTTTFILAVTAISAQTPDSSNAVKPQWSMNYLSVSSGKTPLVNGLTAVFDFSKGSGGKGTQGVNLTLNDNFGQLVYSYRPTTLLSGSATGGFYKNVPWAGPSVNLFFFHNQFITTHWFGWSTGDPEIGKTTLTTIPFLFSYQEVRYDGNNWGAWYVLQHYQKNAPQHIVGLRKKFRINTLVLYADASYVHPTGEFLWGMGINF